MGGISISSGTEADAADCFKVFQAAIMKLTEDHYTLAQRKAWAGDQMDHERWMNRMKNNKVYLAKKDGVLTGFAELKEDVIIDMLYVHPTYARTGVGQALLNALEEEARASNQDKISSYVSTSALPFFEKRGFSKSWENRIERNGEMLINFLMVKDLAEGR
jgi:putative acetyltransferase